jgi:elongation factor 1 alpha-like protein
VEALKMDDTPRAKSKNLDVLAEFEKAETKNAANFVVIGMLPFPCLEARVWLIG